MLIGPSGRALLVFRKFTSLIEPMGASMATQDQAPQSANADDRKLGVAAALAAYSVWGFFPILFRALDSVSPFSVVANRIVWSFFLVGAVLWNRGRMGEVRAVLADWKSLRGVLISAALIAVNWLVFVGAVDAEKVLEVSFGYFITPLVSVAIGLILLGERLNRWQSIAVGVAVVAVAIQAAGLGQFPLVSLTLACSFGFYGYVRKTVNVGSAPGLFVETLVMLPVAGGYMIYTIVVDGAGPYADPWLVALLLLTGPATSGALILFAFAARQLPLSLMGMFQYIAPSIHFFLAIIWFGEPLNPVQLVSFVLIWVSLAIYSTDSYRRRPKRVMPAHG